MLSKLTNPDVIEFIQENLQVDPLELMLSASKYPNLPIKEIAIQIASRQKARRKLPEWVHDPNLIFPPKENLEQASSEKTAKYKAGLFSGDSFLDLTGGTGIDAFYMSKSFSKSTYVEPSTMLCEIAAHNFQKLGSHIQVVNDNAETFLLSNNEPFDLIYLDPSRRTSSKLRVIDLDDYQPNVIELESELLKRSKKVLIKASPMMDITKGIQWLKYVKRVICLSIDNEMKEVLLELSLKTSSLVQIEAVNLIKDGIQKVVSDRETEKHLNSELSGPQKYIYEPNVAIRKAGFFNVIANRFNIPKLDIHTHLYTSDERIQDFPGKCFKIIQRVKPHKKKLITLSDNGAINVISKNYPLNTAKIKKNYGLKDGGEEYLIFTSSTEIGNLVLHCSLEY